MLKLYSFFWDCGRMGEVEGLFVSEPEIVDNAIGKEVYFGEILGKHSEIFGTINEEDLRVESEDQEKISWIVSLLSENISGFNPLDHIEGEENE